MGGYYNIYNDNSLVNSKPITKEDLDEIMNKKIIIKQDKITKEFYEIPLHNIKIVECTVI